MDAKFYVQDDSTEYFFVGSVDWADEDGPVNEQGWTLESDNATAFTTREEADAVVQHCGECHVVVGGAK